MPLFFNFIAFLSLLYFCFVLLTKCFISILFLVQNKFLILSSASFVSLVSNQN